jgi:hypothetical protein
VARTPLAAFFNTAMKEKGHAEGQTRKKLLCVRESRFDTNEFYGLRKMLSPFLQPSWRSPSG